jgi:hypothetical protein
MPFLGTTGGGSVKQYGGQANLGYFIKNSLRLRSSASAYLNRTPASASNRKTWTWSGWVKRGVLGGSQMLFDEYSAASDNDVFSVYFTSSNTLTINGYSSSWRETTQVFRDPAAWYHIVIVLDTTQATAGNRVKLYVNGVEVTSFISTTNPSLNADLGINQAATHTIGKYANGSIYYFDGYLTEINFIDGQALTPSSFGKTDAVTGQWIPKKFAGTYGTNGFYLKFADASAATAAAIGKYSSSNGNNWTPNNISVTPGVTYDAMIDSPSLSAVASNYCVLSPVNLGDNNTISNGNLTGTIATTAGRPIYGSFAVTTGKWYWETLYTASTGDQLAVGVNGASVGHNLNSFTTSPNIVYISTTISRNNSVIATSLASITVNDLIGVALDVDNGTIAFYKNNTLLTTQTLPASDGFGWRPVWINATSSGNQTYAANFGQRPFTYTPPSGFKSLNTYNLP